MNPAPARTASLFVDLRIRIWGAGLHSHPLPCAAKILANEPDGHSSTRAARLYLHAREERDRQLATTLDKMVRRELRKSRGTRNAGQSGTRTLQGARTGSSDDGR